MNKVPLTARGAAKLQEELKRLKSVDRPRIIQAIAEAREHGDLKENAEYHAAKEQQSFAEGRIKEIEAKLSNAQIIDVSPIARALIGKSEGDEVTVVAPAGDKRYEIVEVRYV